MHLALSAANPIRAATWRDCCG